MDASLIKTLFQQARAAQSKGAFEAARAQYNTILKSRPDLAEVHFNLAQIAAQQGNLAEAMVSYATAANLKSTEPAIWAAWIETARASGDQAALADIAKRVKRSGIAAPMVKTLVAKAGGGAQKPSREALVSLMSSKAYAQAETMAMALHKSKPKDAFFPMMLGAARAELGKPEQAEKAFRKAVSLDKSSAEAHGRLGAFLVNIGRAADGVDPLQRAARLSPKSGSAQMNLGWACFNAGLLDRAQTAFEAARALGVSSVSLWVGLGRVALAQKDDQAVGYFEKALAAGGPSVERHMHHATALRAARFDRAALEAYDAALALAPKTPGIMAEKAMMLQNIGDIAAAREVLAEAISIEPENGSLYSLYMSTGKIAGDDPIALKARALYDTNSEDSALAFAVAKLAEAEGVSPFPYLDRGNALVRRSHPYSFDTDAQDARGVRAAYRARNAEAWSQAADHQARPIFVTGLPRSGTTLVEQIIAAHSQVRSAGEVGILGRHLRDLSTPPAPDLLHARYWKLLQTRFEGAKRITDKSISTYNHIGFVKALMPNAKIIVVRRDPRDTAVSIYKNKFADGLHRYSNDLGDIARFTRLHEEQVAFWAEETPDSFTTVDYEAFIDDPEGASRALIAAVDLEWEEACLSFYNSQARVDTLSNVQVRQPIYASSVGVWRKHEDALAPFLEVYGEIDGARV